MDFLKILSMGIYRKPEIFPWKKKGGSGHFSGHFSHQSIDESMKFRGFMGSPKVGTWSRDWVLQGAHKEPGNLRGFCICVSQNPLVETC
jgi:hypothetical protein